MTLARTVISVATLGLLLLAASNNASAQQISPSTPPPPPPEAPVPSPEPVFDPFHAEKSMEIGSFYMKKGNYDAAIDRYEDATRFQPKLARPWRLLGEAYEKKHDYASAVESYGKYLEILPRADDAAAIKKRIETAEEKGRLKPTDKRPSR